MQEVTVTSAADGWQVVAGPYATREEAEEMAREIDLTIRERAAEDRAFRDVAKDRGRDE